VTAGGPSPEPGGQRRWACPAAPVTTGGHSGTYPTTPRAACSDAEGLSTHEAAEITRIA